MRAEEVEAVVTTADIEKLFKQYIEGGRFECADALYLCVRVGRNRASQTLWLRYRTAAPLTAALEDAKQLGISDPESYSLVVEDAQMYVRDVIIAAYESICLDELFKRVGSGLKNLSSASKALLYLALKLGERDFEYLYSYDLLPKFCELIFQLKADSRAIKRAIEELVACYVFQHPDHDLLFPSFFDKLVERLRPELEAYLPKVEVSVTWPSA